MILFLFLSFVAVVAAIFAAPLRAKAWVSLVLTGTGAAAASAKAVEVLATGRTALLWSFDTPLFGHDSGSMDGLSALLVLIIAIGSVAATLYSRGYLAHHLTTKSPAHVALHYTSLTLMSLAMLAVVCSDGGCSFLFFWELMTIASFLLILFDAERPEVRRAALAYLIMMHVGFVLLIVGFARLGAVCGSASFAALPAYFAQRPVLPLFVVFLAGFGMKAGLFPLHVWLPEAHPAAPSHVSALMSGVMIKTGIYGILRVTAAIPAAQMHTIGYILLGLGAVTGLWGVILAAAQNDVKRLLAYSSIENIGVILLGTGIAVLGKASGNPTVAICGIAGALLHTLNHSFFKSLLFFGAGNILSQTRTTSLDALGGLGRHLPVTGLLFLVGTAAICALPPLNGFVSELFIYSGILTGIAERSHTLVAAGALTALALIGGIAVLAFTKLYSTVFLGSPRTHVVAEAEEVDSLRIAAMALPLAGILAVGLFPQYALQIVARAADFFTDAPAETYGLSTVCVAVCRTAWLLMAVIAALAWVRYRLLRQREVRQAPTWGCGFTAPNVRMQYTGESFAEGLQSIARPLTDDSCEGSPVGRNEIIPGAHNYDVRHRDRIGSLFSAWWVEALRVLNGRVMRLRTGKINHYVLFALAFLALIFVLSVFDLL